MAFFYSHIVEVDTLTTQLDEMNLKDDHKHHLSQLVDATIHNMVVDLVLSRLSEEDKRIFIERLRRNPQDKELMGFLKERVETIEDEIRDAVKDLKDELHQDLQEAKQR